MKKRTFTIITTIYSSGVIIALMIYGFNVADDDWVIDFQDQKYNLLTFGFLLFIALILLSITLAGERYKGEKIKRSAIYGGLSIAGFFLVWRLLMELL